MLKSPPGSPQWFVEYDEQSKLWESFGQAGIPILLKAAEMQPGPFERGYSNLWRRTPLMQSKLPKPSDYFEINMRALNMLASVARSHPVPLTPLVHVLDTSKEPGMRMNALSIMANSVLPKLGAEKEQVLPSLLNATHDNETEVRMVAVYSLQLFPEDSKIVIPVLTNALKDGAPDVRIRAAMALYKTDPAAARNAGVVTTTLNCMRATGPFGASDLAQEFFRKLDKNSEFSTDSLIQLLYDENVAVRILSADALGKAGPSAVKAVPFLSGVMQNDHSASVRQNAAAALKAIDPVAYKKAQGH